MKLNTHDRTPRPKNTKIIIVLFALCAILIYGIFGLEAFACLLYAKNFLWGMLMIIIGILLLFRPEWLMFGGF